MVRAMKARGSSRPASAAPPSYAEGGGAGSWISRGFLYTLFFGSGLAALGYQAVWAKTFGLAFGQETVAVFAVVSAVFVGLAAGAWVFDARISGSKAPGVVFGSLEIVAGAWAMATGWLVPWAGKLGADFAPVSGGIVLEWGIVFGFTAVVLAPSTVAMGATASAMDRWLSPFKSHGGAVGAFYAANTLGAAGGAVLAIFLMAPNLGFRGTIIVLAITQILCGIGAMAGRRFISEPEPATESPLVDKAPPVWGLLLMTGFLGISYELLGFRALSLTLENTAYTFALVLSVFLAGTAMGAALFQKCFARRKLERLVPWLAASVSFLIAMEALVLPRLKDLYDAVRNWAGGGMAESWLAEAACACAVFLGPSLGMGALFAGLVQLARRETSGVGKAVAINTAGGALAPILFAAVFWPSLGPKGALILLSGLYALVLLQRARTRAWWVVGLGLIAACLAPSDLGLITSPPETKILLLRHEPSATVSVIEGADGERVLRVDNRFQMGGTAAYAAEARQAHLPLLLHPAAEKALFLGVGAGLTWQAGAAFPGVRADGVELLSGVIESVPLFARDEVAISPDDLIRADARRFVRSAQSGYDVIVGDLFHPARDGAGSLYTLEHFIAVRGLLNGDGIFAQWLPLFQLDGETLRIIVRTFLEVFPRSDGFLLRLNVETPVLGLIGWKGERASTALLEGRLGLLANTRWKTELRLDEPMDVWELWLGDEEGLRHFSGDGPLNTDDLPRVMFTAPRFVYQKQAPPFATLFELLELDVAKRGNSLGGVGLNYFEARDAYLRGMAMQRGGDYGRAMDFYARSAELSSEFTLGYSQALILISALRDRDVEWIRESLRRLARAQPERRAAQELLERIGERMP